MADETTTTDQPGPKELREALERTKAEAEDGKNARRELAFLKAGLDTDAPLVNHLMGTYSGELTTDAIKAWADTLGVAPKASEPTAPADTDDPLEAARRQAIAAHAEQERIAATSGPPADGSATRPVDVVKEGFDAFYEDLGNGRSREEASAQVFNRIFDAAAKGDQSVLWTGHSAEEMERAKQR